jgi:hypothetical protein
MSSSTVCLADAGMDCISAGEMTEIAQSFPQFQGLAGKDYCYDGSNDSALLESVMFMRHTVFDASMPKSSDQLFSGQFANDWWAYFTERINEFSIDDSCPKGVAAYVYGFGGNTMYVCTAMLKSTFAALDRTSIFMHEARHIDGYSHITCSHGPRKGLSGACDNSITDGGSYDVTVETYAQMAKYGNQLHPALRAYSRAASIIYADEAFEVATTIDRQDMFLLMTNGKEFYSMSADGANTLERLGDSPQLGHIVMRARHMILIPDDKTMTAGYVFARNEGDSTQQAHDFAIEYNSQTPEQRADLVDFHIGAQWGARVYKTHIKFTCDPRSTQEQDLSISGMTPTALIYPDGLDRGVETVQMLADNGTVQDIGCDEYGTAFIRASMLTLDQPFKRIYKMGTMVLGLSPDGHLFTISNGKSEPLNISLDGQIEEIAPTQSYGFFGI